ncbi:hypothetical protein KAR91_49805 [Candidatus Pacearchaeota archaeon]|nr:hypothetical protein [Candidatus Pacearchaeota archaeon]
MATQADQKAIRLIQGVIREAAIGQIVDPTLAAVLAQKIVIALRTIKDAPAPVPARKPAFMATPGPKGSTVVEKVIPTRQGAVAKQAEDKKAFIKGDNVDPNDLKSESTEDHTSFSNLLEDDEE